MKYLVLLFCLGFLALGGRAAFFTMNSSGSSEEQIRFEVQPGSSFASVTSKLVSEDLITSPLEFKILGRLSGYTKKIRVGEYELNRGMSPLEVLETISSGKSITYPITIPEGYNVYEIAQVIEKAGLGTQDEFLKLCQDKKLIKGLLGEDLPSLEGYLFPETYRITKYEGLKALVSMMVRRFVKVYDSLEPYRQGSSFSRHQWVILSSIIEKETGSEDDRKYVSSVFHNRLKKAMRLQTDPTVIYGMWEITKKPVKNIRKKDLRQKTRYNTYTFRGLPYGPISNPGREAMMSAFKPAETKFLYFVSKNDGTSYFSETLKEHNRAVRKFQLNRKARQGKSWRDLNK